MDEKKFLASGRDVIYLAACALHGQCPEREAVERMALEDVYLQAARHSMHAITYMAVAKYAATYGGEGVDPALLAKWKVMHDRVLRGLVIMDIEREKLQNFLEARGIWHMPLKGSVLQSLYPRLGMRQMSDADILIDPAGREDVRDLMVQNGYQTVYFATEHPDTYSKGDTCFEIHHSLYPDIEQNRRFYDYYRDVKARLVREGDTLGYRFTEEDLYVYNTAHAYKHFSDSGNGIRSLMDVYVYTAAKEAALDRSYVADELERLGLTSFERLTRELSHKLFSPDRPYLGADRSALTDEERELLDFYIASGTFGTERQRIQKLILAAEGSGGKLRYLWRRLFPSMDYYKLKYPTAYRCKLLIPFFWAARLFSLGFRKPKQRLYELKTLMDR